MKKIVLASTSPRRREILRLSDYEFDIASPVCDEQIALCRPEDYVRSLSQRKCSAGVQLVNKDSLHYPDGAVVIGADTIVAYGEEILGKPSDEAEACKMLRFLSGKTHAVYTGVTVADSRTQEEETFCEKTEVTFYELTDEEITEYVSTGEPMDKAGAYGIQGKGAYLVRKIDGDYFNVVGLPYAHLMRVLKGRL